MNANEIRGLPLSATDHNAPMQEQVRDCVVAIREIAAQLAEANEHLAKIANPPIILEEEKPRLVQMQDGVGHEFFIDPSEVAAIKYQPRRSGSTLVYLRSGAILTATGTITQVAINLGLMKENRV